MILIKHHNNKVTQVLDNASKTISFDSNKEIADILFDMALQYPDQLLIWCNETYVNDLNLSAFNDIFHHQRIFASYSFNENDYLSSGIGYVDQSIYIKVNKSVPYPTWLSSSDVGGIYAVPLVKVLYKLNRHKNFEYFLNSLAKTAMPQGLFCYSDPRLLNSNAEDKSLKAKSSFTLFKFVKQHYKLSWLFFLFVCNVIYEKRFPILPLLKALFYRKNNYDLEFNSVPVLSSKKLVKNRSVDVVIPTIGRKTYLYDVLKDLAQQTVLPKNVIVVEQNPKKNSVTALDYISTESWPFKIDHHFIHKPGVCNARNLALKHVKSEWVFLGDDDIRFNNTLIEDSLIFLDSYGIKAINTVCLQPNEDQTYFKTAQTPIFGSGTSFVSSDIIRKIRFDHKYEFGYGEDSDFGMQIRNKGEDVVFVSDIYITHLKAPSGGYRIEHKHQWDDEKITPKPSPTIMLHNQKYFSFAQLRAYKLILLLKFYSKQNIKNPFKYYSFMNNAWINSLKWSQHLQGTTND